VISQTLRQVFKANPSLPAETVFAFEIATDFHCNGLFAPLRKVG